MSFLGSGPIVAMLRGMNIITAPTPRKTSGRKSDSTPVFGLSLVSKTPVVDVINAQATLLSYADIFSYVAMAFIFSLPLLLLLGGGASGKAAEEAAAAAH